MYDFIHRNKRVLQIVLAVLIVPPFALFGVDFYFRGNDTGGELARVGGTPISQQEFTDSLRQYQERLRQMMGGKVEQAMLDNPEIRRRVLEQLVDERLMYMAALKSGMSVPNAELQAVIADIPAFKDESGKFSARLYSDMLNARGMDEGKFESILRKDLMVGRNRDAVASTAFLPNSVLDQLYRLRQQQREVSQYIVDPSQYAAQVKVSEADAKSYYDSHKAEFEQPEKVKLQYVILTMEGLQKDIAITPKELEDEFNQRKEQLQQAEERHARHILIAIPPNATPEQKAAAKAKADELAGQAKKAPASFAELAKKNSEDPGSAPEGGDLGFFTRGKMVKPFDEAVFAMKTGEIAGPVETSFGYHIIKLDAVKAAAGPTFEAVKPKLEEELRKTKGARAFAQHAEEFMNLVYDQPDSLQPVADKFKLQVQTSGWFTRQGGEMPLLNNPKLLQAAFSEGTLKRGQNTEGVEVAPNMLVSARVVEHEAAKMRPFEEVRAQIDQALVRQKSIDLAAKEGAAQLEKLKKGEGTETKWSPPQTVTRERREGLHPEAAEAVFRADAAKLPAYAGLTTAEGRYVVYRVSKVVDVDTVGPEQRKAIAAQLDGIAGQEILQARINHLKSKADVRIDAKKLEQPS